MKIDKINENKIRCILDKDDLQGRGIEPSELAYGSAKTRELFVEMLSIAEKKFGFTPNDSPLMVEAIPAADGKLILLISKSDDPQDLDTRFSRFSPEITVNAPLEALEGSDTEDDLSDNDASDSDIDENDDLPFDDETIGSAIKSLLNSPKGDPATTNDGFTSLPNFLKPAGEKSEARKPESPSIKIYAFNSFDDVSSAARVLNEVFHGENELYYDPSKEKYYLILRRGNGERDSFGKAISLLYEYSKPLRCNYATVAYIREHLEPIIKEDAIAILSVL